MQAAKKRPKIKVMACDRFIKQIWRLGKSNVFEKVIKIFRQDGIVVKKEPLKWQMID